MKLSVIIVTHNSSRHIKRCLDSIVKKKPKNSEIIVVDNGSTDQTINILKKYKNIFLVQSQSNLGFGKASNLGATKALGEFLFFLNPDTKVIDNALNELLNFAENNEFGIAAPQLIQPDGTIQPSVSHSSGIWNAIKEYVLGYKNSYSEYVPKGEKKIEVEAVYGAALLVRRSLFEKLGAFDERYFMYFEDLDLCRKVRNSGLKIYYLPMIKIYHEVGGTIHSDIPALKWLSNSAKIYHGPLKYYLLHLILLIGQKLKPQ